MQLHGLIAFLQHSVSNMHEETLCLRETADRKGDLVGELEHVLEVIDVDFLIVFYVEHEVFFLYQVLGLQLRFDQHVSVS